MAAKYHTTIYLTSELKKALKRFCALKGISMTDFVEGLVSKAIKRN